MTDTCGVCNRPLTDTESRAAGIGPTCARKFTGSHGAAGSHQLTFEEHTVPQPGTQPTRYRKRPVVIEAMQLAEPNTPDGVARWCGGRVVGDGITGHPYSIEIDTLEGTMRGDLGDWIIKGTQGEFYPVKPGIFAETYEPVAAAEAAG
ncbi:MULTISPECIES: DUF6011 domain-containing protein [Streptomyces]|uniref:DUF6011 domain-containing protein n=1 Tax=Streptomyces flavovirens TaxID=52258 RepID=A0ABV8NAR8_9ACTN|nr:DUF6011 domain-containing protein [Streptomyces sp. MBT51]